MDKYCKKAPNANKHQYLNVLQPQFHEVIRTYTAIARVELGISSGEDRSGERRGGGTVFYMGGDSLVRLYCKLEGLSLVKRYENFTNC